jgi:small GTP-binding protein
LTLGNYSDNENSFFDKLNIPPDKRKIIFEKLNKLLSYEPKVGIFGKTGVGKSSLCNALFGRNICPISDVEACTRDVQEVLLNTGGKGIKLFDVPGVGESQNRDEEYGKLYAKLLPELDLVLWLIKADDRAFASDELFFKNIVEPHIDEGKTFFFVLNQVDKIEPFREWDLKGHKPGVTQFSNIHKKIHSVSLSFGCPENWVIAVSSQEKYNLDILVDTIIFALPREKRITIGTKVNPDILSKKSQDEITKSWFEIVTEFVSSVLEKVEVIADIADTVLDIVKNIGNSKFNPLNWF